MSQDNIDLEDLQRFQDDFAKDIGLASVTVKLKGVTNALNDGLGLISSTMEQLATSASDISKRQTDLNNEIVSVNAVTDKIDAVISFISYLKRELYSTYQSLNFAELVLVWHKKVSTMFR